MSGRLSRAVAASRAGQAGALLLAVSVVVELADADLRAQLWAAVSAGVVFLAAVALSRGTDARVLARRARLLGGAGLSALLAVAALWQASEHARPRILLLLVPVGLLFATAAFGLREAAARNRGARLRELRAHLDGEESERRRWVRELHDETLQEMAAVHLLLGAATSREPLSVPGEHVVPLPPLRLPQPDSAGASGQLRRNEAVVLFAERAAAASGGFALTDANQAAVADLCRRLDGLPLAIELAAVRTRVLTVEQIRDRLTDRFGLLTGGDRAALPRQQTLRTAIDWSHDLLPAAERALLRRLCVFAGRFTLQDVEAVGTAGDGPSGRALDLLSSLVDKSLVMKEDAGAVACYRLHETMREYAALRLRAAGEWERIELRCAEYYTSRCRAEAVDARYRLVEWLGWMDLEIDNVRAVLRGCLARRDERRALELAGSVGWYWITRATSEGVRRLDELLAAPGFVFPPALFLRGFLAVLQSDPAAAAPALEHAARAAGDAGLAALRCEALSMASVAANTAGDRGSALRLLDAAHAISVGLEEFTAAIAVLQARAWDGLCAGDVEAIRAASEEGMRRARAVGDLYSLEMMVMNAGCGALIAGRFDDAEPPLAEALRIARRLDDRVAQYCLLFMLACHAAGTGHCGLAARLLGAADTARAGVGARVLPFLVPLVERATAGTRAALGPGAYRTGFEAGRRLSRDAALALALGEPDPAGTGPDAGRGAASTAPLREREAEVARLVAEGLTNRQIGARLLISEHTVDTHVRNILTKLGAASRAQIAAWVASGDR